MSLHPGPIYRPITFNYFFIILSFFLFILGASSGIGEGTAVHFAKLGARLSLAGRSVDNLSRVAGLCQGQGLSENDVRRNLMFRANNVLS